MKKKSDTKTDSSRRRFLKQSAIGSAGISLAGAVHLNVDAILPPKTNVSKSKVVLVRHSKAIAPTGRIEQPLVTEMVNTALTEFTGIGSVAESWQKYIAPEDVVALKLNVNSARMLRGDYNQHFKGVVSVVLDGLSEAGIADNKIVLFERSDEELAAAGFKVQYETNQIRVMGNKKTRRSGDKSGFGSEKFKVGNRTSRVSKVLTDICSAMINVPVLKDHGIAGVTGALKNHYGSIDNPREMHENNATNPGVAEVNMIPVIRNKQRIIVVDALLGAYDGGPRWNLNTIWNYGGIIIGTDPVAVDAVMMRILNEKRAENGMPSLEARALHIKLSEKLGLGNASFANIDLVEKNLG